MATANDFHSPADPSGHTLKGALLRLLRKDRPSVQKADACRKLAIPEEVFAHHLAELETAGYEIRTDADSIRLVAEPDIPYPWEFPGREHQIRHFRQIPSTMDIARELAEKGCPDFTVVLAEQQTRGRGRLARTWHSDPGGLYFTLVLRPHLPPADSFKLAFSASLTLARILRQAYHVDAAVKWPNDILAGPHKLSGMLSEMGVVSGKLAYVNIGMGINVNNDPRTQEPHAASLKILTGQTIDRRTLLAAYLDAYQRLLAEDPLEDIIDRWKQHTRTIGKTVTIQTAHRRLTGIARDVDDTGALVLEQADGTVTRVIHGDCFHRE